MSQNFAGIATQPYIGQLYTLPIQAASVGGVCVPLYFQWAAYGAGDDQQSVSVPINLATGVQSSGSGVKPLDYIRSVYIDNTGNPTPVFVQFADTNFTISAAPYSTGWYPVFTNAQQFLVVATGLTTANVGSVRVYVTNVRTAPYTDPSLTSVLENNLASPSIGAGSSVASVIAVTAGQDFNNGNMSWSGGGGSGLATHALLDQFGRVTAVVIDDAGTGYTGQPIGVMTGGQTLPAVYSLTTYAVGTHVSYNNVEYIWNGAVAIKVGAAAWVSGGDYAVANTQVSYGGFIYYNNRAISGFQNSNPPPVNTSVWVLVGSAIPYNGTNWISSFSAPGTSPTFNVLLSVPATAIVSSGYGLPALGDIPQSLINTVNATGAFASNLFGSPYAGGYIYLTHMDANVLTALAGGLWELYDGVGYVPFSFSAQEAGTYCRISKANIKLDATKNWQLKCTVAGGTFKVAHQFAYTVSLQ
jgi:hypothetical protein